MAILLEAGLPLDGLLESFRRGLLSVDFVERPEYARLSALSDETFGEASKRTGIPISVLLAVRETAGFGTAHPDDRLRDDELQVIPFIHAQVEAGFRPPAIERFLRALGDNLRRIAEAEADWWRTEINMPRLEAGVRGPQLAGADISEELTLTAEHAMLAIYRAQETQSWSANIVTAFSYILGQAGLYRAEERHPAICFLDITGYTRLTQERGDKAAADLAERLAKLVKQVSAAHAGRPVKWLGDGVMFHFRDPGRAVLAALEMVEGIPASGLPPAHVGIETGPVVFQEGDYYGRTVNIAARIADYARPGEVLVSQAVVDAGRPAGVAFDDIGSVELKGVSGVVQLAAARRERGERLGPRRSQRAERSTSL